MLEAVGVVRGQQKLVALAGQVAAGQEVLILELEQAERQTRVAEEVVAVKMGRIVQIRGLVVLASLPSPFPHQTSQLPVQEQEVALTIRRGQEAATTGSRYSLRKQSLLQPHRET